MFIRAQSICRHSNHVFISSSRNYIRNIKRVHTVVKPPFLNDKSKKVYTLFLASFSALALSAYLPLATFRIAWELASGRRYTIQLPKQIIQTQNSVPPPSLTLVRPPKKLQELAKFQIDTMSSDQLDQDWKLKDFFGQIRVINLEMDDKKKQDFIENAKLIGLGEESYAFVKATYGRTEIPKQVWSRLENNYLDIDVTVAEGRHKLDKQHQSQAGCFMSHYRIILEAKQAYHLALEKYEEAVEEYRKTPDPEKLMKKKQAKAQLREKCTICIMEDDNAFGKVISENPSLHPYNRIGNYASLEGAGRVFREGLSELPDDWEMLYLHAYQTFPNWERVDQSKKNIRELKGTWTTNAYVINCSAFDKILKRLEKIEVGRTEAIDPIDNEFAAMQNEGLIKAYGFYPSIAYQHIVNQSSITDQGDQADAQKNCWQVAEWGRPAITNSLHGSSFGDHMMNYITASWLAYKHQIPLVYKPFANTERLVLNQTPFPSIDVVKKYKVKVDRDCCSNELFSSLDRWKEEVATLFEASANTAHLIDRDDERFRAQLQATAKPLCPVESVRFPTDCYTVALHVENGFSVDFYMKALRLVAERCGQRKLYIQLFLGDVNPETLAALNMELLKNLGISNEIQIGFHQSKDELNSFLEMMQFDCLIWEKSSLASAAALISGPCMEITPLQARFRAEKGKGKAQIEFLV